MQGILIINKPIGYTSQDVVSKVKKILNVKKAGHTGTLDPMATGVLPVLIGEYTKLSKYMIEHDKEYVAKIRFGIKTDTLDLEGNIIEKVEHIDDDIFDINNLKVCLESFLGEQKQIPPKYSAIKVNGKKLYEYSREGIDIEVKPRNIKIYDIKLIDVDKENGEIAFKVSCSKGTYIRVLCEDICKKLNTIGTMVFLERTKVDKFNIEDSITFEELEKIKNNDIYFKEKIVTIDNLFDYPHIILNARKKELFLNGVLLNYNYTDGIYNVYDENGILGLGEIKGNCLKRDVIINSK